MGRNKKHTGPSSRPVQVGEQLRQVLAEILRDGGVKDPRVYAVEMVTFTGVDMTPDLKTARVFVSFYSEDEEAIAKVMAGLNDRAAPIQREVARRLKLRFTPKLEFKRDSSIAYGAKIEALLKDIQPEDAPDKESDDG